MNFLALLEAKKITASENKLKKFLAEAKRGRNIKADIVVGSYELYITDDYAYIGSLEINEQYRERGIATTKLQELAKQYGKLYLCASSEEAERLYSRLGMQVSKEDCPDDISMESLPNEFVLKCTHDSGSVIICRDKNTFDMTKARQELRNSMSINYYWLGREWPYKNIKPRIMAEPFLHDDKEEELKDYKFFCFYGNMKALFIAQDRQKDGEETKFDFFDRDFNHLPIINGHPNAKTVPEKPQNYELMISLAEKLSKGIPQLRVDFYEVNEQVLFGELTFSHWSGFVPFEPPEWDAKFGEWITLPKKRKICDCLKDWNVF